MPPSRRTTTGRFASTPTRGFFDVIADAAMAGVNEELALRAGRRNPVATIAAGTSGVIGGRSVGSRLSGRSRRGGQGLSRAEINQLRATGQLGLLDTLLGNTGVQTIVNPPGSVTPGQTDNPDAADFDVRRSIIENAQQGGGPERQQALAQALFAATPGNPAPVPTHIQQKQELRDLALILAQPPEFMEFAQAQVQARKQTAGRAAAEASAIEKFAATPGTTENQVQEAWEKHRLKYPQFSSPDPPPTPAEMLQQFQEQEQEQFQQQMTEFTEWLGTPVHSRGQMPAVPVTRNKDGQLEPVMSNAEIARLTISEREREQRVLDEAMKNQLEILKLQRPELPKDALPEDKVAHERQMRVYRARLEGVYSARFGGRSPRDMLQNQDAAGTSSAPEVAPATSSQVQIMQQRARSQGMEFAATPQEALQMDVPPGTPILLGDGRIVTKE